ncbi:uncharacterized protein LOC111068464 [Drosophila obscura]|uniref:uncharacterized protein LOC111068464 n=1 Tax=Drosophila obscura TaxID=7282 RepID=UPI001BB24314|nr:uncharacterized protein LOC111068464 [Drosophila obscura]
MLRLMGNRAICRLVRAHMYRGGLSRQHRRQDGGAECGSSNSSRSRSRDVFHGKCYLQRTNICFLKNPSTNDGTCGYRTVRPKPPHSCAPPEVTPPAVTTPAVTTPAVRPQPCPSIPRPCPQTFEDDTSFCPSALLPSASVAFGAMNCDMQSAPLVYALPQFFCIPAMPYCPAAPQVCPRSPERSINHGQSCSSDNDNIYLMQSPTPAHKNSQICGKQSPPGCSRPQPDSRCQTAMRPPATKLCSTTGGRPQRRCFSNGQGGQGGGRKCHPNAYPVPMYPRQMDSDLDPLGPRCDFGEAPEAAPAPAFGCDAYPPSPQNESMRSLQPVAQGMDPVANFDLDRFDRDLGEGIGRRRNVHVWTCINYDYEPNPGHCAQRSQPPPGQNIPCAVQFPRGSDETAQPNGVYIPNHAEPTAAAGVRRRRNITVRRCAEDE